MTHSARFADLDGASVFISGGGSGIGAALTEGFLAQGAKVAFVGRSDSSDFVAEMRDRTGAAPLGMQGDVTDIAELRATLDRAEAENGPLDVLVNNVANDQRFDSFDVTEQDWDSQHAVNLKHLFFASQHVARSMKARGGGRIVNLTSIVYMTGQAGLAPYVTAKAGITGLTRTLAREWGCHGIRVNALAPGMVLTEKQLEKWIDEETKQSHKASQALDVELGPPDMVGPVLFLASDASAAITGQCLVADAGVAFAG